MMTVEMVVMALFMVMFMMNPAGLNPMNMVHQPRLAAIAGVVAAAGIWAVALLRRLPRSPPRAVEPAVREQAIRDLGTELLGGSMLVFETAGVTLLATMVCAVVLSSARGRVRRRRTTASVAPPLEPGGDHRPEDDLVDAGGGHDMHGHGGHDMHGGHG